MTAFFKKILAGILSESNDVILFGLPSIMVMSTTFCRIQMRIIFPFRISAFAGQECISDPIQETEFNCSFSFLPTCQGAYESYTTSLLKINFVKFVWNFLNNNRKWILSIYYVLILNKVIIFLKILTTFGQFKCYGCILWMISLFLHCSVPVSDTEPSVEWNGFMWLSMETRTKKQKKKITKKKSRNKL